MKKPVRIQQTRFNELERKEKEYENLGTIFKQFSDERWQKEGDMLRRIQLLEASNQQLSKRAEVLKDAFDRMEKTARTFADHKERDAETIAMLMRLLDDVVRNYKILEHERKAEHTAQVAR